jgi:hypothetical protein
MPLSPEKLVPDLTDRLNAVRQSVEVSVITSGIVCEVVRLRPKLARIWGVATTPRRKNMFITGIIFVPNTFKSR